MSGVFELLGAVGLMARPTRRAAGIGLFVLTILVTPANLYMWRRPSFFPTFRNPCCSGAFPRKRRSWRRSGSPRSAREPGRQDARPHEPAYLSSGAFLEGCAGRRIVHDGGSLAGRIPRTLPTPRPISPSMACPARACSERFDRTERPANVFRLQPSPPPLKSCRALSRLGGRDLSSGAHGGRWRRVKRGRSRPGQGQPLALREQTRLSR